MEKTTILFICLFLLFSCSSEKIKSVDEIQIMIEDGNTDEARIELMRYLQSSPNDNSTRIMLGKLLLSNGNGVAAAKEFQKAIENNELSHELILLYLRANLLSYDFASISLMLESGAITGYVDLSELYHQILNFFQIANSSSLTENVSPLAKAFKMASDGFCEDVLSNQDSIELNEFEFERELLIAQCFRKIKDYKSASISFEKLRTTYPRSPILALELLVSHLNNNNYSDAKELLKEFDSKTTKAPIISLANGLISFNERNYLNASEQLTYALQNGINSPNIRTSAAISFANLRKFEQAYDLIKPLKSNQEWSSYLVKFITSLELALGYNEEAAMTALKDDSVSGDLATILNVAVANNKNEKLRQQLISRIDQEQLSQNEKAIFGMFNMRFNEEKGLSLIEEAIEQGSDTLFGRLNLIGHYVNSNDIESAFMIVNQMLTIPEFELIGQKIKIALLIKDEQFLEARQILNVLSSKHPEDEGLKIQAIRLNFEEKDIVSAEKGLKLFVSESLSFSKSIALLKYYENQLSDDYIDEIVSMMKQKMRVSAEAAIYIAEQHIRRSQPKIAYDFLSSIQFKINSDLVDRFFYLYAYSARLSGEENEEAIVTRWIAQAPNSPLGTAYKLSLMRKSEKSISNVQFAQKSIEKFPRNGVIKLLASEVFLLNENFSESKILLRELPFELKDSDLAVRIEAMLYFYEQDYDRALEPLEKSYSELPSNLLARMIFLTNIALNDVDKGIKFMRGHLDLKGSDIESLHLLANVLMTISPNESVAVYRQILSIRPTDLIAGNNLGWLLIKKGDYEGAQSVLELTLNAHPKSSVLLDTLAELYIKLENKKLARTYLELAIKYDDSDKYKERLKQL